MNIDPEQIATVCSFCDYDATSAYRDVLFCRNHLMWFYLSLHLEWND